MKVPKGDAPHAIGPSGSSLSTIEGGFVVLIGAHAVNEAIVAEDGFCAMFCSDAWSVLREAIKSRTDVEIPMAGNEERIVRRFRIESASHSEETMVIDINRIRLYLPDDVLRERLGDDASLLGDYIKALQRQAAAFWGQAEQPKAKGLLVAVGVHPDRKARVWCDAVDGEIPGDLLSNLENKLGEVPDVAVKQGPIAFAIEFCLWGQKPDNFPEMPNAWVEASNKSNDLLLVPDGLFKVIWPEQDHANQ